MKMARNPAAKALAKPQFRQRIVNDKTKYSRKGRGQKASALSDFWVEVSKIANSFSFSTALHRQPGM